MRARLSLLSDALRNSYWFLPGILVLGAVALSYVMVWADRLLQSSGRPGWLRSALFDGTTTGAAEILGTTASSMITVAGVVFSITVVVLSLASGQFGPRLLDTFMRDRGTQVTLGTFVGGFSYSLMVLRSLDFEGESATPTLSVSVALLWALAGVAVLIHYIHHISIAIQAPQLIDVIAHELGDATRRLFPDPDRLEHGRAPEGEIRTPDVDGAPVDARSGGYVEAVDLSGLVESAREHDLVLRLETGPGRFVVPGTTVAVAWPAHRVDDRVAAGLADAVLTGARRSNVQDVEFPVQQLAEIAVRALSPAVNDPFTAVNCVDQLSVGLCALADREFPPPAVADEEGVVRVVVAEPVTFDGLVRGAFAQVRQNAAHHSAVHSQLLLALSRVAGCVSDPDRLAPLVREGELVVAAARRDVPADADLQRVEQDHDRLGTAVSSARRRLATPVR